MPVIPNNTKTQPASSLAIHTKLSFTVGPQTTNNGTLPNTNPHAGRQQCRAIVIENPGFADARAARRETVGRAQHGKRLRTNATGIPIRRFRTRLALSNQERFMILAHCQGSI
jgi:hypothetical protein